MISWKNLYHVLSNVVPLYVVMILAYSAVKWWKIFSPSECVGINRFVVLFAAPALSIKFIANNNPYAMNYRFIAADTLQKVIVIVVLVLWCKLSSKGSLEWCITLFSLSTLTNTLVVGIPLLGGMYGETPLESLMVQLSVIQFIIWYPSLLFLFEYRKATVLIPQQCCGTEMPDRSTRVVESCRNGGNLDEQREICGVGEVVLPSESSQIGEGQGGCRKSDDHDLENGGNANPKGSTLSELGSRSRSRTSAEVQPESSTQEEPKSTDNMDHAGLTTRLILFMVCKKLIKNPNFYSSIIALVWSLISFRWHLNIPAIVANSIKILSDAGLGMAMFSLGLFMASQPRIIAGGSASAALAAAMRFIVGPAITTSTSAIVGLKGTLLQIIIMQAALPQAIVPFIFAREYNVHPGILSTAVSFGMLISLPITLVYYILLGFIIK
ncbi:probable auxin efflux carrier component 1d [Beta vulgaris subsp. vulgaris]|uniref:probable auxin efflux carrier component 1d n=1 Tax=Beta vulgaris subsp. vulgaris TaxID=3555 RepID=UPI002037361C|nr:probable auxin efflux carrier component 1d [Beta vulgaris subsp. vulgaris]